MIYIIDHKDSFTHNVVHQFENFDDVTCDNYNEINEEKLKNQKLLFFHQAQVHQKTIQEVLIFIKNLKVKKNDWYMSWVSANFTL